MDAIRIEKLSHRYRDQVALDKVSLSLPAGQTIALVGPDGVGKSTLLAIIAGVRKVQSGTVEVLGKDICSAQERSRLSRRIAYMPQGLGKNLYPSLSIWENLDFFARLFGEDRHERERRMWRLLDATGLAPFSDRPANKLSGGMKQKLGLCCALVHEPDLLILDEPTTGVDPLSRKQFWSLVDTLRQERPGMTILVATAYMDEAQQFDHLIAINDGQILAAAPTRQVLQDTHASSLEEAYVALLPEAKRGNPEPLKIPPYERGPGPAAIAASNLTRQFGDFVAVDKVSFEIGQGEIFGFLGSNGCGKTTTMKMLTGLLEISSGSAELLGQQIDARDISTRTKVGYMSQAFSLYEELTTRQNLALHARLYQLDELQANQAVTDSLKRFDLIEHADVKPTQLSLGIKQRLQLAAACLHKPEVLILDEPTSGVDPAARDMFWRQLIKLSREDKVTIFVSTHFMNEAERCDRISLMHRGRVLAVGTPAQLRESKNESSLEEAFIRYLEEASSPEAVDQHAPAGTTDGSPPAGAATPARHREKTTVRDWLSRVWAFTRRESTELYRDPIRLTFALLGPIILLITAALSISFDIERIAISVSDHDQSPESRQVIEHFTGSRYFAQEATANDQTEIDRQLRSHHVSMVIDIPPGYGRDLIGAKRPEIAFYIDGAQPFLSQNLLGYVNGVMLAYANSLAVETVGMTPADLPAVPVNPVPRFKYNQEFRSIYASTPGLIMLGLIIIPTMLTTLGIVREKELGSITNLYASPATVGQFLIGKQLPYVGVALASYLSLLTLSNLVLQVPLTGSFLAFTLGALCFVFAATALGLLISAFFTSQVAATFASVLICLIPSMNFSGLLYPVSTMTGLAWWVGKGFPSSWFQTVSLGAMTKGLGLAELAPMAGVLFLFGLAYLIAARLLVHKQEL